MCRIEPTTALLFGAVAFVFIEFEAGGAAGAQQCLLATYCAEKTEKKKRSNE